MSPLPQLRGLGAPNAVAGRVQGASRDALAALKLFAGDPVGGLARAYEAIGAAKAQSTGIAFGVVSVACFVLGGYLTFPFKEGLFDFLGFGGVLKCLLFAVMPFLCATVGGITVRRVFGGQGSTGGDVFVAGAALLPVSLCMLLAGILGLANIEVVAVLSVFAGCLAVLMLFSGYTRIARLSDRAGSLSVPIVVLLGVWLTKILATSVLSGPGNAGMPPQYFNY
ncbi:MAG TPA: hypothetical protein VFY71_06165 [Planctomycetota bacterium]|nr:hypothetical protein [Planctomycetota bacterium]